MRVAICIHTSTTCDTISWRYLELFFDIRGRIWIMNSTHEYLHSTYAIIMVICWIMHILVDCTGDIAVEGQIAIRICLPQDKRLYINTSESNMLQIYGRKTYFKTGIQFHRRGQK